MTKKFREALKRSPASIRALAREAGISHVSLIRIRDGDQKLTTDVRKKIIRALRVWSRGYARLADNLEREGGSNG